MKKAYIIIIIAFLVICLGGGATAFYLIKKKGNDGQDKAVDDVINEAQTSSAMRVASKQEAAVTASSMSGEDEEYNLARENYRKITGEYPPRSWTQAMIETWIDEQNKKNAVLAEYIKIVSGSEYAQDEHTADMTLAQLEALVSKAKNQIAAGEKAAAEKKMREKVSALVVAFQDTLNAPNYYNLCLTSRNAWDTSVLVNMRNLSKEEKVLFNKIFAEKGGAKLPGYFNQIACAWQVYHTVYSAILDSNTCTGRSGASEAKATKEAFKNIAAGAVG